MKTYSKGKLKLKRAMMALVFLFVALLIAGLVLLFAFCLKDNIEICEEKNDAVNVSDDVAANSQPIIIDNLVVGATYNSRWVSANKYYLKSNFKSDVELSVYNKDTRAGVYKIKELYTSDDSVFVNTTYPNYIDEYFALPSSDNYALISQFKEAQYEEKDIEYVKDALGIYKVYNNTMSIKKVYNGYINIDTPVRLITVNSTNKGAFGGIYNAVIIAYPNDNKAQLVQYNYTKDFENADDYPLSSVEFLADFNGDGNSELILREVTEFNVTYNIFEYQDGKYFKVLSETMKGK